MNRPKLNIDRWLLFATYNYKLLFKNVRVVFSRFIKSVTLMLLRHKRGFLDYKTYHNKVVFIDRFYFQQNTRKQNIKNIKGVCKNE